MQCHLPDNCNGKEVVLAMYLYMLWFKFTSGSNFF